MDKKHKLPVSDRNPKKTKTDAEPSIIKSPSLKGKVLKVIPPKAPENPGTEMETDDYVLVDHDANQNIEKDGSILTIDQSQTPSITVQPPTENHSKPQGLGIIESAKLDPANVTRLPSPKRNLDPMVRPPSPKRNSKQDTKDKDTQELKPPETPAKYDAKDKVVITPIKMEESLKGQKVTESNVDDPKLSEETILNSLKKMEFKTEKQKIVQVIQKAKTEKKRVVITDKRLLDYSDDSKYLGHIVYTGATSRSHHSNRGADLELFLIPEFNSVHHFATIQVRIPAEFLSYRGNIAVRKSALWGTDIYTDDSDVVASNIFNSDYSFRAL